MRITPHHTYIFESDNGAQISVTVWPGPDSLEVTVRPDLDAIWGPPLTQIFHEGDPIQFDFAETEEYSSGHSHE